MILNLFSSFKNLINFGLIDPLDISELLFGSHDNAGYGAKPISFQLRNICDIDPVFLQLLNLNEVCLLQLNLLLFLFLLNFLLLVLGSLSRLLLHSNITNSLFYPYNSKQSQNQININISNTKDVIIA